MVGFVTGQGTGLERSSARTLGAQGQIGSASQGRGGDNVFVNAATGNLLISRADEVLLGLGPDITINRTYNSQGSLHDGDNDDNWRIGAYRRIVGANGNATVTRIEWDGSETLFKKKGTSYVSEEGAGAYDALAWDGAQWLWTDSETRATETYDATGKLVATRDSDGNVLTYTYTGSLITRVANQNGEYTDLVYGGAGGTQLQRITTQAATGSIRVRYSYDASNRLSTVTVDLSPADGSLGDGNAYVTTYTYDGASKRVASIAQSDGSLLEIAYTATGSEYRVTKLTERVAGSVTRVTGLYYDLASRITTITDALGGATTMRYDAAGNLTQITHPQPAPGVAAPSASFGYNEKGDVVSVTQGGRTTSYEYDNDGNLKLSRDAAGNTVARTYGTRNELLTSTQYLAPDQDGAGAGVPSDPVTTRFAYDGENHLRFVVSGEGRVTEYRYNAAGTLAATLAYAGNFYSLSGLGPSNSIAEGTLASWAAGVDKTTIQRTDSTYDFRGNLHTVTAYSRTLSDGNGDLGSTYTRTVYAYDSAGNLLSRQVSGLSGSETFLYDGLNRIVRATDTAGAVTIITFNDPATTTTVAVTGGLTRVSVFNKAGERISVTESGAGFVTATGTEDYDALGRLRKRTDSSGRPTYYLYDALGRIAADVTGDGAVTEYGYDSGHRLVKTIAYMNRLSTSQIALLSNFSAGGTGGAAAGGVGGTTGSNRVVNGSFEDSGSYTSLTTGRSNTTLPGWTKANGETFEQVASGQMGVTATDGGFWLDLESIHIAGVTTYGNNLLTNGSFSQSGTYTQISTGRSNTDLPGWLKSNPETFEQVASGQMGVTTQDGGFWLDLESVVTSGPQAVGPSLLVNGGFEMSGDYQETATGRANFTMPGWNKTNPEAFEQVDGEAAEVGAIEGLYVLDLDSVPNPAGLVEGPNLIVNGSFEQSATSYTATATGRYNDPALNIPGWTKVNGQGFEQIDTGVGGVEATHGSYYLDMEANGDAESRMEISQTIGGLTGGQQLTLRFDYANIAGQIIDHEGNPENSGSLEVYWNDLLIAIVATQDAAMVTRGFTVTSIDGDNVLRFREIGVADGTGVYLDNVQLRARTVASNLIVNGSFEESAAIYDGTAIGRYNDPALNIPGWTKLNSQGFEQITSGGHGIAASEGNFYLDMEALGDFDSRMDISQVISGLKARAELTLTFDFANTAGTVIDHEGSAENSGALEVYWNGILIGIVATQETVMTTKTFTVSSISGDNTLRFREIGITDGRGVAIDNVQLFETPPPSAGGNMNIYQTVSGLTQGQIMQLQYDHGKLASGSSAGFEVWWNDTLVATHGSGPSDMQTSSYFVTAIEGENTLRFKATGAVDGAGAALDNVRLFATESPPNGGNMDIHQTVHNLAAGQIVQLQFDHANRTTAASGSFEVWWNGSLIDTIVETGATMRQKTYNLTAVAGSNTLRFRGTGTVDAAGASIDNVRLLATQPVPTGGNMDISQTIANLTAGQVMLLEFDHANRTTGASGSFEVLWNGVSLGIISETGTAMRTKSQLVTAIAGNNTLRFRSLGTVDAEGASIDNVRLLAVQGGGPAPAAATDPLAGLRPSASADDYWTWSIYDSADRLIETIDSAGRATVSTYDGASRLVSTTSYATPFDPSWVASFKANTPVTLYVPAANSATDRASRMFYDNEGRLVGTLDGSGGLSQVFHDAAGRTIREIAYANPVAAGLRASGTFAQLLASAGSSPTDRRTDMVYDQRGLVRFTIDAAGHPTEFVYDAAGNLIRTVDYFGQIATGAAYSLAYVEGQIAGLGLAASPHTRVTRSVYDGAGRLAFSIDAEGGVCHYSYDQLSNLVKETRHSAIFTTAGDQSLSAMQGWAAAHSNDLGNRVTRQVVDAAGRAAYSVDAEGYVTEQRFDLAGRLTQTIRYPSPYSVPDGATPASVAAQIGGLPAGAVVTTYAYDSVGRLVDLTDGESVVTHYVYDALGRVTDETLAYGTSEAVTVHRNYDAAGRVSSETGAYGTADAVTTSYGYDALGNLRTVTDARNYTTVRGYDAMGNMVSETSPADAWTPALTTTWAYDRFGNVVKSTDARLNSTFYHYDRLGRLVASRDSENYVTETAYNVFGDVSSVTRRYNRANNAADPAILPTYVAHAKDAATLFHYDRLGRSTVVIDAETHYEQYWYDAFGQRVTVRNKLGGYTYNSFDRRGQLVAENVPTVAYDKWGNVTAWTVTNRFEYDARGNRKTMWEAHGLAEQRVTTYVYDKLDRLIEVHNPAVAVLSQADQAGAGTSVIPVEYRKYDRLGRLIETIDALGARTLLYYDRLHRQVAQLSQTSVNGPGTLSTNGYDANGNILSSRVFGTQIGLPATGGGAAPSVGGDYRETTHSYDSLNRMKTASVTNVRTGAWNGSYFAMATGNVTTTFDYDANGNVIKTTNANNASSYSYYDKANRRIAAVDEESYLTAWTLDAEGNVTEETRLANKVTAAFSAATDPAWLRSTVPGSGADRITQFGYDRNGRRTSETRLNVFAHALGGGGALVAGNPHSTIGYSYNGFGQVTQKTFANNDYTSYTYDSAGRLTEEYHAPFTDLSGAWVRPTTLYSYDAVGNLSVTRQVGGAWAPDRYTRYTYGAGGRLTQMTDAAGNSYNYAYDAAGNVLRESYDRLKSDGNSVTEGLLYSRDVLGRVISQALATWNGSAWARGDTQDTAYNAYGDVAQRGVNGGWQEHFAYDGAGRLYRSNSGDGVWRFFMHDGMGNQTLTLESEGTNLSFGSLDGALAVATANGNYHVGGAYIDGINATINVFDQRGQAKQTLMPKRQLNDTSAAVDIAVSRTYNAFGEVASETDARNFTTDFTYNTMGRLIQKQSPEVSYTPENGVPLTGRPTEYFYHDAAGRLIGARDANGNLVTRALLGGTGHGGAEALVTYEYHADGGYIRHDYDVHGDRRVSWDEIFRRTDMSYDAMGRVTQISRPNTLVEYFTYDLLGQRITHWNNFLQIPVYGPPQQVWVTSGYWENNWEWVDTSHWEEYREIVGYTPDKELTDYDLQGRVTRQVAFGGDTTLTTYSWNGGIGTNGLGVFGTWIETATMANGLSTTEYTDVFGHQVYRSDLGGHAYYFSYDLAGRLIQRAGAETLNYTWLNTGKVARSFSATGDVGGLNWSRKGTTYGYDASGNLTSELLVDEGRSYYEWQDAYYGYQYSDYSWSNASKNATATYDGLNRMATWAEAGSAQMASASTTFQYDLNGNIRRSYSLYREINAAGTPGGTNVAQDNWYRYDSMNRLVTKGSLVAGQIVRGANGGDYLYDHAGQRMSATTTALATAQLINPYYDPYYGGDEYYYADYEQDTREDYTYDAGGVLSTVRIAQSGYTDDGNGVTFTETPLPSYAALRAKYTNDLLGRVTRQEDFTGDGAGIAYDRSVVFNNKGQVTNEEVVNLQGWETIKTVSTHDYGSGANYALGAAVLTYSSTSKNNVVQSTSSTSMGYIWYEGALQSSISTTTTSYTAPYTTATHTTSLTYDGSGSLTSLYVGDGRPRSVTFVNDANGQAIKRDESDNNGFGGDPHEIWHRFGGKQMGYVGNNGTLDTDYAASITNRTIAEPTVNPGAFRFGQHFGGAHANFDLSGERINSYGQGGVAGGYTVRQGDTLETIAAQLWGDSSLWYKLAQANGMSASNGLTEGQRLTIPAGVMRNHHNASTFKPFDPSETLGDISPTTPTPQKTVARRGGKCGMFGQILLVVIAVAVTALTYGAAAPALGPVLGGAIAGAAGSIASQAFGVATGIQEKFSWKGVAMAAISGAVSGGVGQVLGKGAMLGSQFLGDAIRGAAASALTQGVGVAVGLQRKFDFAAVAAAGVGAGVLGAVSRHLEGKGLGVSAKNIKPDTVRNAAFYANQALSGAAGAIANAATRSVANGSDFGDNLLAALPDIIGSTIGNMIADGVSARIEAAARRRASERARAAGNDRLETLRRENPALVAELEARGATLDVQRDGSIALPGYRRGSVQISVSSGGGGGALTFGSDREYAFGGWLDPHEFVDTHDPATWRPGLDDGEGINFDFDDGSSAVHSDWISDGSTAVRVITSTGGGSALYFGGSQRYDALGLTVSYGAEITPTIDYAAAIRSVFGSSEPRYSLLGIGGIGTPSPTLWQRAGNIGDAMYRITIGPGSLYDRAIARPFYQILDGVGSVLDPGAMMAVEQATAGMPQTRAAVPLLRTGGLIGRGAKWASGAYFGSRAAPELPAGSFSISDWSAYPAGVPRPQGPFRLVDGGEYEAARTAANKANATIRRERGLVGHPVDVHEIHPVKFGGSPTDPANKVILPRNLHRQQVTPWWNQLQRDVGP